MIGLKVIAVKLKCFCCRHIRQNIMLRKDCGTIRAKRALTTGSSMSKNNYANLCSLLFEKWKLTRKPFKVF